MKPYVYDIIRKPIITEASMASAQNNRTYVFKVAVFANKIEIKKAVEEIFKVKVEKVNTMRMKGKPKRVGTHFGKRADWKKAMVKLVVGSKALDVFSS